MAQTPRFSRVLTVLEFVARSERPARIADIAKCCALPKATVHRICRLLRAHGYLQEEWGGKGLVPGPGLSKLADMVQANQALGGWRHAVLESVARRIGETCNISVPDGAAMVYRDRVETEWPLKVQLPIGTRVPLHCTASGKLYLASLPPPRRRRLLDQITLDRLTANTITDINALEADLERIASERMGTDDEEFIAGMIAISVPITDADNRLFATLSFHAPVVRMSLDEAKTHAGALRQAACEIATDFPATDKEHAPQSLGGLIIGGGA